MASWDGQTNPRTGRPFESQAEYDDYEKWSAGQGAGARAAAEASDKASRSAGPGYSWGDTSSTWTDPTTGYVYFGNAYKGDEANNEYVNGIYVGKDWTKSTYDQGYKGSGYIDPHTGQFYYNTTSAHDDPTKPGYEAVWDPAADRKYNVQAERNSRAYDYTADYGLGPDSIGVIPIAHDASGTPIAFYAGTKGGGGQVFDNLAAAQASVKDFRAWYNTQHPGDNPDARAGGGGGGGGQGGDTKQPTGELLNPGAGENYFDSTKDFYTKPSEASQLWGQTKNQPTASQQNWNAYSGIFGNPEELDAVYDRGRQAAETTLARRSASAGWGDSGAAARATGNLGIAFTDAATKAKENWALTGGNLAAAADTSNNQRFGQAMSVDQGDLARITAGQSSAGSAQNLKENRLTGGLSSALQLGQAESALIYSGLTSGQQQELQLQLQGIQLKMEQGKLTAEQAYAEAQNYMQTLGVAGNAAINYYVDQKLGKKT